jgi:hypothetical protein
VAVFKALFQISTKTVHNFVDKAGLDSRRARIHAAYDKLPVVQAKHELNEIKDLQSQGRYMSK